MKGQWLIFSVAYLVSTQNILWERNVKKKMEIFFVRQLLRFCMHKINSRCAYTQFKTKYISHYTLTEALQSLNIAPFCYQVDDPQTVRHIYILGSVVRSFLQ